MIKEYQRCDLYPRCTFAECSCYEQHIFSQHLEDQSTSEDTKGLKKEILENKTIALIAHDSRKSDMIEWVKHNIKLLLKNKLVCTGTTGKLIEDVITTYLGDEDDTEDFNLIKMKSGPMGGDAQIASMVVEGKIDLCVFLIDDLSANPHEADIMMLLRQCRIHNIPVACNRHSADLMITSKLWGTKYKPSPPTYIKFKR